MPYLSNGSVAWEIPEESAVRYKKGLYRPPAGWFVLVRLPKNSRQSSSGQWYPPTDEVFVDDRRIQAAASKILRKQRKIQLILVRSKRHAKNVCTIHQRVPIRHPD
jgi:hypothetical protein